MDRFDKAIKICSGIIIAAFFLPFISISCEGAEIAHASGIALVIEGKPGGLITEMSDKELKSQMGEKELKVDRSMAAVIALGFALVGFGVSFMRGRNGRMASLAVAGACFAALVVMYIQATGGKGSFGPQKKDKPAATAGAPQVNIDLDGDGVPGMKMPKVEVGSAYGLWLAWALLLSVMGMSVKSLLAKPAAPGSGAGAGGMPMVGGPPPMGGGPPSGAPPPGMPPSA